jgi:hypothetical protein
MSVMTNSVGNSVGSETVGSSIKSAGSEGAESAVEANASVVETSVVVDESSPPHAAIKRVDESVSARRARDVRDDICNTLAVLG